MTASAFALVSSIICLKTTAKDIERFDAAHVAADRLDFPHFFSSSLRKKRNTRSPTKKRVVEMSHCILSLFFLFPLFLFFSFRERRVVEMRVAMAHTKKTPGVAVFFLAKG